MMSRFALTATLCLTLAAGAAAQSSDSVAPGHGHGSGPAGMNHDSMMARMARDPAMRARHDSMMARMANDPAMRAHHDSMMARMAHDPAMRAHHDSMMRMMGHDSAMPMQHDSTMGMGMAHDHAAMHGAGSDTGFAALQRRGRTWMGVDQYRSTHRFDALSDGGRIELQSDAGDSADVQAIRRHFTEIARAFKAGDFSIPGMVHQQEVPGTRVMAERRDRIRYTLADLPRGAELRLTTTDPEAVAAIHEFMAFQRREHHAGGRE